MLNRVSSYNKYSALLNKSYSILVLNVIFCGLPNISKLTYNTLVLF